jgi:hypothetical protein
VASTTPYSAKFWLTISETQLTVFAEDTYHQSILVDVLDGVLDLEETTVRVEAGTALIVS